LSEEIDSVLSCLDSGEHRSGIHTKAGGCPGDETLLQVVGRKSGGSERRRSRSFDVRFIFAWRGSGQHVLQCRSLVNALAGEHVVRWDSEPFSQSRQDRSMVERRVRIRAEDCASLDQGRDQDGRHTHSETIEVKAILARVASFIGSRGVRPSLLESSWQSPRTVRLDF
jgi:hypothetical protein